jgi:hypothetical protein
MVAEPHRRADEGRCWLSSRGATQRSRTVKPICRPTGELGTPPGTEASDAGVTRMATFPSALARPGQAESLAASLRRRPRCCAAIPDVVVACDGAAAAALAKSKWPPRCAPRNRPVHFPPPSCRYFGDRQRHA